MKKKLFAISDIHGYYKEMIECLNKSGYDENNDNHLLIVVGDIFDRGTESLSIYKYLKKLTDENKAIVTRGNHDTMLTDYLSGKSVSPFNYIHNGTNETLAEFLHQTAPFETWCIFRNNNNPCYEDFVEFITSARKEINGEYPELLEWLSNLPFYYETKNYIFTHGGIDVTVKDWHKPRYYPINTYKYIKWDALTWDDGSFFGKEITNTDKKVVIGHFGTEQLRKMYPNLTTKDNGNEYDILYRDDGRIIALDTTTILSKKINVLVIEDDII